MNISTADLSDAHPGARVCEPCFNDYGGQRQWAGAAVTVRVFEDNSLVRQTLEEPGQGRVLVVDGGGSKRCALVGDVLAQLAIDNGWVGILVYGCIRDSATLATMPLGIKALATSPRKSVKKGLGERDVEVAVAGTTISSGDHIYCDEDGVLVSHKELM